MNGETIETQGETVSAAVKEPSRDLLIRFNKVISKAERSPKFRAHVYLPFPLEGLVVEAAIFENRDKSGKVDGYAVMIPGGNFKVIKAAEDVEVVNGRSFTSPNPEGERIVANWEPAIKKALNAYLEDQNPLQTVRF